VYIGEKIFLLLIALSALPAALFSAPATADAPVRGADNNAVLHLGKIDVHGQRTIIEELQAIKVGLQQHFSNDPKLADTIVCTLENQAGSHIMQRLSCATNSAMEYKRP
jgi:hypothetical protein